MENLKTEIEKDIHWVDTYNKMMLKQGLSKDDKNLLWKLKVIYKDDIIDEIVSGKYEWSIPRKVEIAKHETGKKRVVYIYSIKDRYILGVLYRAFSEYYKDTVSDRCFSYIKGTNTSNAIKYLKNNRTEELKFGVKMDIHAYFNSVSENKVKDMINELFSGGIRETIEKLMLNKEVQLNSKVIQEWKSLIPGCALGSFFANYTLRECDQYFDNKGTVYARYSDDIIVLEDSKEKLQDDIDTVLRFLDKYGLTMNPEKYTWFEPNDSIQYLGLKLEGNGNIDISDHAKFKIKKQIHRWCRKGRMEIERDNKPFNIVARRIIRQINNKNFFCAINHDSTFGWGMYSFPKITTTESLFELDMYTKESIYAMKTGKHNKGNYSSLTEEDLHDLGWISLVEMYNLYKFDYEYFMEIIEILRN